MHDWRNKENLSLLVTDSGLGGLSICAGIVRRLVDSPRYKDFSVVYFNAWPMQDRGYNYLDDDAARVRVFGNALRAMNTYRPDLILIACNTLSVIFQKGGLVMRNTAKKLSIAVLLIVTTATIAIAGISSRRLEQREIPLDHPAMDQLAIFYKLGP